MVSPSPASPYQHDIFCTRKYKSSRELAQQGPMAEHQGSPVRWRSHQYDHDLHSLLLSSLMTGHACACDCTLTLSESTVSALFKVPRWHADICELQGSQLRKYERPLQGLHGPACTPRSRGRRKLRSGSATQQQCGISLRARTPPPLAWQHIKLPWTLLRALRWVIVYAQGAA